MSPNNSELDIDALYEKWIKRIDGYRSNNVIVAKEITNELTYSFDVAGVKGGTPPEKESFSPDKKYNFLEPRCHAFYRMIGLPITDGSAFISPGYDYTNDMDKKVSISNSFLMTNAAKTSEYRQTYLENILNIFSVNDINSTVLALTSKNKRKFADCIKDASKYPVDITKDDCKYKVLTTGTGLNGNNIVNMLEYTDYSDNKPTKLKNIFGPKGDERYHFILPLVVDPRISFATGGSTTFNVPFFILSGDNSDTKSQYQPPIIEKVIIRRLSVKKDAAELTDSMKENIDTIDGFLKSTDPASALVKENIKNLNIKSSNVSQYYANFINLSLKMMKALKNNIEIVNQTQKKYHFMPTPSSSGPEYGCTLNKIYSNDGYNTALDKYIVTLTCLNAENEVRKLISNFLGLFNNKTEEPVAEDITDPISSGTLSVAKETKDSLTQNIEERKDLCDKAITALKYIEYINGEFSGFGLVDILVITSALYITDIKYIVSLLDDTAYERMKDPRFGIGDAPTRVSVSEALKKITETIKYLYSICDYLFSKNI